MEQIVSLAKRRGFIFPGSEIYGGLAGTWDFGPLGLALKNNIKQVWWKLFVDDRSDMYGVDAAILMNPRVWEASGHVAGFSDPLVECVKCKRRFRADHLEDTTKCPECGGALGEARQFNMMFKTHVGAMEDATSVSYLRPETAGGIFVNFKNIVDTMQPKLPFGIAQIGKAFRNEIAPRDFLFRSREFEQMEIEYFIRPDAWESAFKEWQENMLVFAEKIGLTKEKVVQVDISAADRAHYSKHSVDTEFVYPFGQKELWGLAYRTDFDLSAHAGHSGAELSMIKEGSGRITPHVIEPSFGVERTLLAVLASAYDEDEIGGDKRVVLRFTPAVAPIRAAVFPLVKNKPDIVAKAREVHTLLKEAYPRIHWDDNGNIGKRYRRQDEIGTPHCITVDYQTLEDQTVTVRDRDTGEQERVLISELVSRIK